MAVFTIFLAIFLNIGANAATIAIIDTGFDLDHDFLQPKIMKHETDEEGYHPDLIKEFHGWDFHDNSHLKSAVIKDPTLLQDILRFRNLRAKGHGQGLTFEEFDWFKKKTADKAFIEKARSFKKHSHGTFVAGIALREGENINIFPIRGLNIPSPVLMVEDNSPQGRQKLKAKTSDEKFKEEIRNSYLRVTQKFSKICKYLALNKVNVVNASYGITYKNIKTKFRESYLNLTGQEIPESKLENAVSEYFEDLYRHSTRVIKKYPQMLFVFSAGNSGLDNDLFHHYPSRIKLPNTITVAAMNGEYLASFSNFGLTKVDIGAPGVAIPSIVPKIYSGSSSDVTSLSSGTSMAAPYISNIAAQIMNTNEALSTVEVKSIILQTGDEIPQLKGKISSGAKVNNSKAIKAALLSKDMSVPEAINLAKLDLIPMEDKINFGGLKARTSEPLEEKMMKELPQPDLPADMEDDDLEMDSTRPESSSPTNQEKGPQDNSVQPVLPAPESPDSSDDQAPASSTSIPPQPPSEETPASSSQSQSTPTSAPLPESEPSSPQ